MNHPQDFYNQLADTIFNMQAEKNSGNGITCIRDICNFLKMGKIQEAKAVYNWDADKFADSHPDLDKIICINLELKPRYGTKKWKYIDKVVNPF